jgi:hypothetical protein
MIERNEETGRPPIVDLNDTANVAYWCAAWGVTKSQLVQAVNKVGNSAPAIAFALGKEAYSAVEDDDASR